MKKFVAAILATAAFTGSASAATIVNGSFEDSSVNPGGGFATLSGGSTAITGWTVGANSIDYIGGYWTAQDGTRSLDLSGNQGPSSIAQTITDLVNGQAYRVSYWVSKNPDGGDATRTGTVTLGNTTGTFSFSANNNRANMLWEQHFFDFVANGTSGTLSFGSDTSGGCCFGPALDNVSIAAIPEPATWAMMIAGIGLVGATMRRRRTTVQFA